MNCSSQNSGKKGSKVTNVLKIQPLIKRNYKIKLPLKPKPLKLQKPLTRAVKREINYSNTHFSRKNVPLFRRYNYAIYNRSQSSVKRSEWEDVERIFGNRLHEESTTFTPIISYAMPINGNRYDEAATEKFTEEYYQRYADPRNVYASWSIHGAATTEPLQFFKIASKETTSATEAEKSLANTDSTSTNTPISSFAITPNPAFDNKEDSVVTFSTEYFGPTTTEESPIGNRRNSDGHNEGNNTAHSQNYQGYISSFIANSTNDTRRNIPKGFSKTDRDDTNVTSRFSRASPGDEYERNDRIKMEQTTISSRERQSDGFQTRKLEEKREHQFYEDSRSEDDQKLERESYEDHHAGGSHISRIFEFNPDLTRNLSSQVSPSTEAYFEGSPETKTESNENEWQSAITEISRREPGPNLLNFPRGIELQQNVENAENIRNPSLGTGYSSSKSDKYNNKAIEYSSRSGESISIETEREPEEFFEDMERKYGNAQESNEIESFQREQEDFDKNQSCSPEEPCMNQINGEKHREVESHERFSNKNFGKRYAEGLFINSQNGSFSLGVEKKDGLTTFAFYKN